MIIVGGTYFERVIVPESEYLLGSGVRAAAALANLPETPSLVTAVDESSSDEAAMVRAALRVKTFNEKVLERSEPVGFTYVTPMSPPSINGPAARVTLDNIGDSIEDAETLLRFGLIERGERLTVSARTVIIDPQKPRDTGSLELDDVRADRVIVVANRSEAKQLGGEPQIISAGVSGVVTKLAAAGCTVTWIADGDIKQEHLGAHPTHRVWPIGSGDVFSAGLAAALDAGADLVDAARIASASAAHWCSTRAPALPVALLNGDLSSLPAPLAATRPRIYLAGPFFSVGERWLVELVREALHQLGASVFSPVHDVGVGGAEVAAADLEGLRGCDAMLALLDGADPGTVFEVGWAVRSQVPVVGYASVLSEEVAKMMAGTAVELHRDLSTACYRATWAGMGLRTRRGWHS